ncbi:hypothetical protein AURDEDRAFT_174499 [Auricularia subglabra TFB-10046 SS5]|uniref:F-box domain-containing protein n=1 Tax=Auricularia subglabra (strain TFB-10046 / SS5) TaxID=717982 RepID=J0CYQ9_AURST|nr:hypothetical protein AURDEDRAFT_174499 [Auricularia subglabra TFB-10046 SS5]
MAAVVHQLPIELACAVFEFLCFADRVSATHVCKCWRTASLEHGVLWSHIRCRDVAALTVLLGRALRVPVDLEVFDINASTAERILDLVEVHLCHIRVLSLKAFPKLDPDCVPRVHRAFANPAPHLEVVDVRLFDGSIAPGSYPDWIPSAHAFRQRYPTATDAFLPLAPRLRQLSFRTLILPNGPVDALSTLARLELDAVSLSAAQIFAIASLPRLRSLHLDIAECEVPPTPPPPALRLEELRISGAYPVSFSNTPDPLLRYLGFPHIRHFASYGGADWLQAMTCAPRSLPHTVIVEHWSIEQDFNLFSQAWRLIDDGGFVSDHLDVFTGENFRWPDARPMLANLRELVILNVELKRADHTVEFPQLLRLCVRFDASCLSISRKNWPAFSIPCPKLRTLELWGTEDPKAGVFGAQILHLVGSFLLLDRKQPPDLIIRDLVVIHTADEWKLLEGVMKSIQRPEGLAPRPFVVEVQSKWRATVTE